MRSGTLERSFLATTLLRFLLELRREAKAFMASCTLALDFFSLRWLRPRYKWTEAVICVGPAARGMHGESDRESERGRRMSTRKRERERDHAEVLEIGQSQLSGSLFSTLLQSQCNRSGCSGRFTHTTDSDDNGNSDVQCLCMQRM